jgi:hypothetical protein
MTSNSTTLRFGSIILLLCLVVGCSDDNSNNTVDQVDVELDNPTPNVTVEVLSDEPSIVDPSIWPPASFDYKGRREIDQQITSTYTGATYAYHVYLPPEYDEQPERSFPVLYFTDGEWYTDFQFRVIDFESRPIIAVGIEHENRRGTDYVWPGAETYHLFLTDEFLPVLESQYRILQNERTLKGDSGGGSQTLISMFLDQQNPPVFKNHMAFDPYIAGLRSTNIQSLIDGQSQQPTSKKLVITGMRQGFQSTVDPFVTRLKDSDISGLEIYQAVYDLQHTDATWSSFSNALEVIYEQ